MTGGARGIGREVCLSLAGAGHRVAVADILMPEARDTATDVAGLAVSCDVTSSADVAGAIATTVERLGPIDILVNCAGWDRFVKFVDTDEAFWDHIIEINYKGVLRTTHAVLPGMHERRWGRIVNLGSDAGRVGSSLESVYSGTKGAVIAFTKTIARESAKFGVTANTVCPGPTDTQLLTDIGDAGELQAKIVGALGKAVPMGRLIRPDEVAAAVAFFASEPAGMITGQTLSVSGGLTMA